VAAPAKSYPPATTRWVGQRLWEALWLGNWFAVHQEGVAHRSSASHGDSSQSGEGCLRQVGTVAVAVGSPVGEERGTPAELGELVA
jgi:hypothetical protein